jgi:hypothetical protein
MECMLVLAKSVHAIALRMHVLARC